MRMLSDSGRVISIIFKILFTPSTLPDKGNESDSAVMLFYYRSIFFYETDEFLDVTPPYGRNEPAPFSQLFDKWLGNRWCRRSDDDSVIRGFLWITDCSITHDHFNILTSDGREVFPCQPCNFRDPFNCRYESDKYLRVPAAW